MNRIVALLAALVLSTLSLGCALDGMDPNDPEYSEENGALKGGKPCTVIGLCIEGYHWDSKRCSCVRDAKPAGQCQPKCQGGESCQPCKTLDGFQYFCLPAGTAC